MLNKNRGFTLLEVLVALSILAIALLAVMKISGQSVAQSIHVKNKIVAHMVAMNVLAEIKAGVIKLNSEKKQSGVDEMLGENWDWDACIDNGGSDIYQRVLVNVKQRGELIDSDFGFLHK